MQPDPDPASRPRQEGSPPPPPDPMPTEEEQAAPEPNPDAEEAKDAPAEEVEEAVDQDEEVKGREAGVKDGEEQEEERRGRGRKRGRRPGAPRGLVMVKRELLARCMTCPLCNRLLRDATTVSECLHTFCRKCIYKKFNDEEVESCPVCDIDLGCTPVEKLRADHSLQDVRSKIFPSKRKKIKVEDVASPDSPPNKRKERSISSLVVHTPRLTPTGSTGRRTKVVTRKAAASLHSLGPTVDNPVKKENSDKSAHSSSLPANLGKVPKTKRQILSNAEEASNYSSNKDTEDDSKDMADNAELWRPLNCLVEAANRTKSFRSSLQGSGVKREQLNGSPSTTNGIKTNPKEHPKRPKTEDDKKDAPVPPVTLKRKLKGTGRRRSGFRAPADGDPDGALTQNEKRFNCIWFSLVASLEQKGDSPLPQIPSHYLRIKDANIPASSIQKYLVQKLSLPSESEVEINCCGQPVNPTQPLRNLVELWLRGRSAQATQAIVGSPAEEFVMVLNYGRPKPMEPLSAQ
ncbi:unnamed protein product [Triticum turgidum subsp. durum]|uniref:RING-type domain-containing protein n=2 Tax=Triticum turgidum subsp. durum TaxID=4567 RepID=A0A9R0XGY1_TRITD|nr:unnamed protein product [Triticum turgidum subsp. durum]